MARQGEAEGASVVTERNWAEEVEQLVELNEVLADVADRDRELRFGELGQHYGLAPPLHSAGQQGGDAVGDLELLGV